MRRTDEEGNREIGGGQNPGWQNDFFEVAGVVALLFRAEEIVQRLAPGAGAGWEGGGDFFDGERGVAGAFGAVGTELLVRRLENFAAGGTLPQSLHLLQTFPREFLPGGGAFVDQIEKPGVAAFEEQANRSGGIRRIQARAGFARGDAEGFLLKKEIWEQAHKSPPALAVEPRETKNQRARTHFRDGFFQCEFLVSIHRERARFVTLAQRALGFSVENIVGGELHKDGSGFVAAAREVQRGVEVGAIGAFGIVLAGVEVHNRGGVDDGVPRIRKKFVEPRGVGDVGFGVRQGTEAVPVGGEFRVEMSAQQAGRTKEKDFQVKERSSSWRRI